MTYSKPKEEFEISYTKVTHTPTGAWWAYYHIDGGFSFSSCEMGTTDRQQANEVNYYFDELTAKANKLFGLKHYPLLELPNPIEPVGGWRHVIQEAQVSMD